jgi:hypothetical protein
MVPDHGAGRDKSHQHQDEGQGTENHENVPDAEVLTMARRKEQRVGEILKDEDNKREKEKRGRRKREKLQLKNEYP